MIEKRVSPIFNNNVIYCFIELLNHWQYTIIQYTIIYGNLCIQKQKQFISNKINADKKCIHLNRMGFENIARPQIHNQTKKKQSTHLKKKQKKTF